MNVCTPIAAAAAISFSPLAVHAYSAIVSADAPGDTAAQVEHTPGPMAGTGVYRLTDAPDIAALCTVGADGRRTLLPVEALDATDLWAGVGLGWQGGAPLPLLPAMVVTEDGASMAYSGRLHFAMSTVDGMPTVQADAYAGITHIGAVVDVFDGVWWLGIDASGETHFGRGLPDGSVQWQKSAPVGARPLVQRGEAEVSDGPAGCDAKAISAAALHDVIAASSAARKLN